jgi:FkbM family methyltransferase
MPIVLDVGAAAFGPPEYYTGSDSLLVLKVSDVAVSVHAFEMQHSVADQLQKEAMLALKIAAPGSTHEVHRIGVGAKQSELLASPMEGTDKVQTLTLTGGSGQSKRNHVFRTRVTSLDWWESEHSFNRSILYIKVDTNGHEPAVLQGLTRLMSVRPPLFLSFEYSFGWSTLFSNITIKLMRKKARALYDGAHLMALNAALALAYGRSLRPGEYSDTGKWIPLEKQVSATNCFFVFASDVCVNVCDPGLYPRGEKQLSFLCSIDKLKNQRRVATRYDHTAASFLGFVLLGCLRTWIRFVHAA